MRTEKHPLGFRKFVLCSVFGFRLRLHYWPRSTEPREAGGAHNHRWWFVSVPLFGCFTEERFVETPGNDLKISVRDSAGRDSGRVYEVVGNAGLRLLRRHTRFPLLPFRCGTSDIHIHCPKSGRPHASLVLVSPLKNDVTYIWRDPKKWTGYE